MVGLPIELSHLGPAITPLVRLTSTGLALPARRRKESAEDNRSNPSVAGMEGPWPDGPDDEDDPPFDAMSPCRLQPDIAATE